MQEDDSKYIFRGRSEAKHMMYNSAQRCFSTKQAYRNLNPQQKQESYDNFIKNTLETCKSWNNGVIGKLMENSSINPRNDLALLSYMQHNQIPSPLLDFTLNPYIALYFAIENINYSKGINEIDNYFSIYYTNIETVTFSSWTEIFDKNSFKQQILTYDQIKGNRMSLLFDNKENYQIVNNLNIINQEGLFFYNSHHSEPIEISYINHINNVKNHFLKNGIDKSALRDTFCACCNIHKSKIPEIQKKLKEKGITSELIKPNLELLKKII
jgi:hypothetical protein